MKYKRITFSWLSPLLGFHVGRNPVSGQRFVHVAPLPFIGIDFDLPPYGLNKAASERLATPAEAQVTHNNEQGYQVVDGG